VICIRSSTDLELDISRGFGWIGCGIARALELVYRKGEMVFIRTGFGLLWLERG
jgi:hypothetical protein